MASSAVRHGARTLCRAIGTPVPFRVQGGGSCASSANVLKDSVGRFSHRHSDPMRSRRWLSAWSLPARSVARTTHTDARAIAAATPTPASATPTPSQPRATNTVTDREILAKQRNPDEYLAITRQNIRTFGIIAHVDHGKSTLADRLLEITGAVPEGVKKQYLDRLPVERSRGITVKAQSVTLLHDCPVTNERYLLNLIDTPGHADFAFEVSRSLLACDEIGRAHV